MVSPSTVATTSAPAAGGGDRLPAQWALGWGAVGGGALEEHAASSASAETLLVLRLVRSGSALPLARLRLARGSRLSSPPLTSLFLLHQREPRQLLSDGEHRQPDADQHDGRDVVALGQVAHALPEEDQAA